jgi:hypothetical protein
VYGDGVRSFPPPPPSTRLPASAAVCCCEVQELINKIDKDGSGEIEYEEFKTLLS